MLTAFLLYIGWRSEGSADLYDMLLRFPTALQQFGALLLPGLLGRLIWLQNLALLIVLHLAIRVSFAHFVDEAGVDNYFPALLRRFPGVRAKKTLVE
jgi:hypothetical protein